MPGRQTRRNRPPGEDAAKRDRAVKALDLRIGGATYRQIGAHLGVSECTAYHDVQDELDAIGKEKAERLRELEIQRLDALTMALAPGIQSGDVRAILATVRVMERRAKLLGLDGPQQFAGPDGGPVAITVIHQQIEG